MSGSWSPSPAPATPSPASGADVGLAAAPSSSLLLFLVGLIMERLLHFLYSLFYFYFFSPTTPSPVASLKVEKAAQRCLSFHLVPFRLLFGSNIQSKILGVNVKNKLILAADLGDW